MSVQYGSHPSALDLMLKSLISHSAFNVSEDKNWMAISKTIPGTTPKQVC